MNRKRLKQKVFTVLESTERSEICKQLESFDPQEVINPLFSSLCSTSEKIRWNGIYCFGLIVSTINAFDREAARIIMRRLLWSLNDESGGIGWGAPEAMAEIMACDEQLANEYLHMLLSYMREDGPEPFADGNFLELPMLQRGLLWGIGRLCETRWELLLENAVGKDAAKYLASEDGQVRGLAVWCLLCLKDMSHGRVIKEMVDDDSLVDIHRNGAFLHISVGDIARQYISMSGDY